MSTQYNYYEKSRRATRKSKSINDRFNYFSCWICGAAFAALALLLVVFAFVKGNRYAGAYLLYAACCAAIAWPTLSLAIGGRKGADRYIVKALARDDPALFRKEELEEVRTGEKAKLDSVAADLRKRNHWDYL